MSKHGFLFFLLFSLQHLHTIISLLDSPGGSLASLPEWQPMPCNSVSVNPLCNSYLYVTPEGRNLSEVASDFSGNASLFQRITRLSGSEDLLVNVPCVCEAINSTMTGLFHDSNYTVKAGETGDFINSKTFSGLALNVGDGHNPGREEKLIIHLPCGCSSTAPEGVLSYAVQDGDTLGNIASLFRSSWKDILDLNPRVANPDFIKPGWILFIPMGVAGPSNKKIDPFQTERPVIFSLIAIEDATSTFDEKRKIGEGGYGSVYLGFIGTHEIAVKKMKASKSKEFFAELKVLCKIHHINVVELIGYAAGDDHLYLVYEYVQNGSLSEHLHDPLLKGHQPLSWTARTQIAMDSARGIEYIHDHTKTCYVHRDIKTSNILLDNGLRAKVADFGLVKLVQRSDEDECLATRLVGTPGYLPPESVLELHMTTKSDVYAFGVVLAELITGLRALVRDNKEANKTKSLISIMRKAFKPEDLESSLETIVDPYLKDNYPIEEVCKLANISMWCLSEDPLHRPEMREVLPILAQIHMASIEWEASLGGDGEVFSGVSNGR
uniref:Protein kinase domain-containing protein n=1 Tax=Oryza glumipatula TaxID=40148 RepID=A0A0D9YA92_9ORYZ